MSISVIGFFGQEQMKKGTIVRIPYRGGTISIADNGRFQEMAVFSAGEDQIKVETTGDIGIDIRRAMDTIDEIVEQQIHEVQHELGPRTYG